MLNRFQAAEMVCLDVGTNTRVQIHKLFGPSRYPFAKLLNKSIGAKRNESNELCAIGIEMNPSHTADCQPIEKHYNSKCCHRVRIFTETAGSLQPQYVMDLSRFSVTTTSNIKSGGLQPRLLQLRSTQKKSVSVMDLAEFFFCTRLFLMP